MRSTYISFAKLVEQKLKYQETQKFSKKHKTGLHKRVLEGPGFSTVLSCTFDLIRPSLKENTQIKIWIVSSFQTYFVVRVFSDPVITSRIARNT